MLAFFFFWFCIYYCGLGGEPRSPRDGEVKHLDHIFCAAQTFAVQISLQDRHMSGTGRYAESRGSRTATALGVFTVDVQIGTSKCIVK